MSVTFTTLPGVEAIVITVAGHIDAAAVDAMRAKTVAMTDDTGYTNYLVDISELKSIAHGDTFATFDLGERFRETGIRYRTRTAVIMPTDAAARQQAEFLHTVEMNRGRGDLCYVTSSEEAQEWFMEASRR
jgi:hypothetical protein